MKIIISEDEKIILNGKEMKDNEVNSDFLEKVFRKSLEKGFRKNLEMNF